MSRTTVALAILVFLMFVAAAPPEGTIQVTNVAWKAGPPSLPKGAQAAVLEGDPKSSGIFTMRLKLPAGTKLPPHWHPRPERVTVLSGEARVGFGDTFDASSMKRFPAGSFYVNPPQSHHFVSFPKETVLQMTGEGPWELHEVAAH